MMNVILKYFWMYILIGLLANIGTAIAFAIWAGVKTNFNNEAMEIILDIIGGKGYHAIIQNMLKTKEGRYEYFRCFILTQLVWPTNVATLLSKIPDVRTYVNEHQSEFKQP